MRKTVPFQYKLNPKTAEQKALIERLRRASQTTSLSMNQLAALSIAAGLPKVEESFKALHQETQTT